MKDPIQISILICTRNRSRLLSSCLESLIKQTRKPFEVVVVDNNSKDDTNIICQGFKQLLPLRYITEPRIGIPFARNAAVRAARGTISALLDDDCIATNTWVAHIHRHFMSHPSSFGLVGFTQNRTPNNIWSNVEYFYYIRWILQNVPNLRTSCLIQSGLFVDTKNSAFKRSLLIRYPFSSRVPFGDMGMMEDVEFGCRITDAGEQISFVPSINVKHKHSQSFVRLIYRNFWEGYGSQNLEYTSNIHTHDVLRRRSVLSVLNAIRSRQVHPNIKLTPLFILMVYLYPLASGLGKFIAKINHVLQLNTLIPQRQ